MNGLTGIYLTLYALAVQAATLEVSHDDLAAFGAPSECYRDINAASHQEALALVERDGYTLEQVYEALNSMDDDTAELISLSVEQVVVNPYDQREPCAFTDDFTDSPADDWPDDGAPLSYYLSTAIGALLEAC